MSNNDPLTNLLVTESQAVNKADLAELLTPYLLINKVSKDFDFSGDFWNLPNAEKVLIILAGVKARSLTLGTEDRISPSEIIKMEVAPVGSIKISLKNLLESKDIRAEKSRYYLPNYKLSQVIARLNKIKTKN